MNSELINKINELFKRNLSDIEARGANNSNALDNKNGKRIIKINCDPGSNCFSSMNPSFKRGNIVFVSEIDNYIEEKFQDGDSLIIKPLDDSINWFFKVVNIIDWHNDYSIKDFSVIDKASYNWKADLYYNDGSSETVNVYSDLPKYTALLEEILVDIYNSKNKKFNSTLFR